MKKIFIILTVTVVIFFSIFSFVYSTLQKTTEPLISVIMPTYNRAHLLPQAINSILNQTYKNFEFIIINDGSSDKTQKVLKEYQKKDHRIILLSNDENKGIVTSLNKGLEIAKGKYIARMDDDDISLPRRLERQVYFLEANPDITVLGSNIQLPKSHIYKKHHDIHENAIISHFETPLYHPTVMMRTSFFKKHNLKYDNEFNATEDSHLWFLVTQKNGKIQNLDEVLVIQDIFSPKNYNLTNQSKNFQKFLQISLSNFLTQEEIQNLHFPLGHKQFCYIIKSMEKKNSTYPQEAFNSLKEYYCH